MIYLVSDAQLVELQTLVWGAHMFNPSEPHRFNELIQQIKRQPAPDSIQHEGL